MRSSMTSKYGEHAKRRLTQYVLEKRPLNGRMSVNVTLSRGSMLKYNYFKEFCGCTERRLK